MTTQLSPEQNWYLRHLMDWHADSPTNSSFRREFLPRVGLILCFGIVSLLACIFIGAKFVHPYFVFAGWLSFGQSVGIAHMYWLIRKSEAFELWPLIENALDFDRIETHSLEKFRSARNKSNPASQSNHPSNDQS